MENLVLPTPISAIGRTHADPAPAPSSQSTATAWPSLEGDVVRYQDRTLSRGVSGRDNALEFLNVHGDGEIVQTWSGPIVAERSHFRHVETLTGSIQLRQCQFGTLDALNGSVSLEDCIGDSVFVAGAGLCLGRNNRVTTIDLSDPAGKAEIDYRIWEAKQNRTDMAVRLFPRPDQLDQHLTLGDGCIVDDIRFSAKRLHVALEGSAVYAGPVRPGMTIEHRPVVATAAATPSVR